VSAEAITEALDDENDAENPRFSSVSP